MAGERGETFDVCFDMLDEQMLNDLFEDDIDTAASDMGLKQDDLTHFSCETCSKMYKIKGGLNSMAQHLNKLQAKTNIVRKNIGVFG